MNLTKISSFKTICFVFSILLFSCDSKEVAHLHESTILKADSLFRVGDLANAKLEYKQIWNCCKEKGISYQLAKSHILTENKDSAYYYLNYALEGDTGLYHLFSGEFYPLINDSLYNHLADRQLMKYQTKFGSFSKPHLSKKLFLATVKDQAYYYHLSVFPDRTEKYAKIKKLLNRENLEMLDEIVVEHGWPKRSEVGFEAAPAAFFIVQHAESVSTLKNYLSYIKNAVDEGEVDKYFLAFLLDKINFREGEKQVYGTQIAYDSIQQVYFLDDVVDPENLAKRRAEMNLEPIEDYIKRWKGAELRIFDEKDSIN